MKKQQVGKLRYVRIAPRKVRLVAKSLKGLPVWQAQSQLMQRSQRSAPQILELLKSTVANAKNNTDIDVSRLVVKSVTVDGGPSLKRFLPRAQGNATPILKRMSHITLTLEESDSVKPARFTMVAKEKKAKTEKKAAKPAKAEKAEESKKKAEKKTTETKAKGQKKSGGVVNKMFRRKSI
ncbi:MAG: 50S ribosomal protein L22 [Candidatus Paceibacterota bacterium]